MDISSSTRFISRRSPVIARGAMVASSQPLATQAGVNVLSIGGSAADAAIAVAAMLNVTQPCSTGLGGDCFCLYYNAAERAVLALNGSGRSAASLTLDRVRGEGHTDRLPRRHAYTVTVPGAPAAWYDVHERLGRLPLARVLAPAIRLAEEGFPVAPLTSMWWQAGADEALKGRAHGGEMLTEGRAPGPGEIIALPTLAASLRTLAEEGKAPFYTGAIAERIVSAVRAEGGELSLEDLADHDSEWVDPISTDYRGYRVYQCPPNGHGLAALLALNIAREFDMREFPPETTERYHLLIECMRLAFADSAWYVADPALSPAPLDQLLSKDYAVRRSRGIDPTRANRAIRRGQPEGPNPGSDTVYFCAVDGEGNGCSFINSTFLSFGSGIVPEGCGYTLQNRGLCFRLEPDHPNCLAPRKRPYHTIIPGLCTRPHGGRSADASRAGDLHATFGVMGGMMQPQGHLQVVSGLIDDALDPQAALDRARFQLEDGAGEAPVLVEGAVSPEVLKGLGDRGHEPRIVSGAERHRFGLGQIILTDSSGVLWAGSDPRGDGCAGGF